ncbi:MAG TPA: ribosome-binding factor A [Acidimicrobiales bacterium]|nr:ribosome-binding factor A [Acidimicrobiales bacterium]
MNALLHEVVAEELERRADSDERLRLLTVTGVACEPDLRHAAVYLASIPPASAEALALCRRALQQAIGRQLRLRRVPVLEFRVDPAIVAGERVDAALRRVHRREAGG